MSKMSLTKIYLCWLALSIAGWVVSWVTGSLWELMGQSVDLAGSQTSGMSRDEMIIGFIAISLVYWFISVVVLGVFVALTNKQKKWARLIFIIICLYQLAYESYAHYSILMAYQAPYELHDYLFAIASLVCIICMLIKSFSKNEQKLTIAST